MVEKTTPVSLFVTSTVTPGSTAPDASMTVPVILPLAAWENPATGTKTTHTIAVIRKSLIARNPASSEGRLSDWIEDAHASTASKRCRFAPSDSFLAHTPKREDVIGNHRTIERTMVFNHLQWH